MAEKVIAISMGQRNRVCKPCQKRAWHDGPSSRLINGRLACDGEEPCNNCQSIIRLHEPYGYSEPQSALPSQHERQNQLIHETQKQSFSGALWRRTVTCKPGRRQRP